MARFMVKSPLERYRCLWEYAPRDRDELELEKDDILLVAQKFEDGWAWGIRLREQKVGAFPMCLLKNDIPPILRERSEDAEDKLDERSSIIRILYFSELSYNSQLELLDKYIAELEKEKSSLIRALVHELKEISYLHDLSSELFIQLTSRVAGWNNELTMISNLFSKVMSVLTKLFKKYAVAAPRALDSLLQITQSDPLRGRIEPIEENCTVDTKTTRVTHSMKKLSSIIASPMTQLCKYQQLMKLLCERTAETHPDYTNILSVSCQLENLYRETQLSQNYAQNELKLKEIIERFGEEAIQITEVSPFKRRGSSKRISIFRKSSSDLDLEKFALWDTMRIICSEKLYTDFLSVFDQPHNRFYICEGKIDVMDYQGYIYLFDDLLLIAQASSPKLKLMCRLNLTQCWITDVEAGEEMRHCFKIGSPHGVFKFIIRTHQKGKKQIKELKDHWVKTIENRILAQKKKFEEILSVLTIPSHMVFTVVAKAKLPYFKISKYELSFEEGDKVRVFCIYDLLHKHYRPGIHLGDRYQDPSTQWCFGMIKNKQGWFPKGCVNLPGNGFYSHSDVSKLKWAEIALMKKTLLELSNIGLQEIEDKTVQVQYQEVIKNVTLPSSCTINDLLDLYFGEESLNNIHRWNVFETSLDTSFRRKLEKDETPSNIVNFWGQGKEQLKFVIEKDLTQ